MSLSVTPPASRQYLTDWAGNAESWRMRVKRSSCAAATISPSCTSAAALS
jgi:hypothetical protein